MSTQEFFSKIDTLLNAAKVNSSQMKRLRDFDWLKSQSVSKLAELITQPSPAL
jgi:hypothetical protein